MFCVELYTEDRGFSTDIDATFFETLEEAENFFNEYDIAFDWNRERQCRPVGTMKKTVFCAELWHDDDCLDRKEYSYSDYIRSE